MLNRMYNPTNLRDMFFHIRENYRGNLCIVEKNKNSIAEHTVDEFCSDVIALGTSLVENGYCNKHIAILSENSYRWIVTFFAICCSGNVAVPLDKELPESDILSLLKKSDSAILFCSEMYKSDCFSTSDNIEVFSLTEMDGMSDFELLIQKGEKNIQNGNTLFQNISVSEDSTAVIIFTSGTTGTNKGVALTHKNLTANAEGVLSRLKPYRSILSVLPMNHIFELGCGILPYLYKNAVIYINDRVRNFNNNIKEWQPEIIPIVPLFAENICRTVTTEAKRLGLENLQNAAHAVFGKNLPTLACGGAHINSETVTLLNELGFEVIIGYGLTETSPIVSINTDTKHFPCSVGTVLPKTEIKLNEPNEYGIGEIIVKGNHVSPGYYRDETSSKEVFADGWFSTGDYGKIENGNLYITGRKKNLIILDNGKNIFPEEIENFFCEKCNYLKDACVFDGENTNGQQMLIMAVVPSSFSLDEKEIMDELLRLNKELPAYKKIARFSVFKEDFPKTATKKTIRSEVKKCYKGEA